MLKKTYFNSICCLVLLLVNKASLAAILSITPLSGTALPTSIKQGQTATAYYVVKNNSPTDQKNISIRFLPPNAKQVLNGGVFKNYMCGLSFDLSKSERIEKNTIYYDRDRCLLQLTVTGPIDANDPDSTHHLAVCQDGINCSGVSNKEQELNVTEGETNNLNRLAIVMQHSKVPSGLTTAVAYRSVDGGMEWLSNKIGDSIGFIRSMSCGDKDGLNCVAVGDAYPNGRNTTFFAYTSTDGGINWTKRVIGNHGGASGLSSVTCNEKNCVAVGTYSASSNYGVTAPIVYTSSDGGNIWAPNYPATFGRYGSGLRAVSCGGPAGQYCTAVGDYNSTYENHEFPTTFLAYTSSDGGMTWSAQIIEKQRGNSILNSIACSKDGQDCLAVGQSIITPSETYPIIYKSIDGGINWFVSHLSQTDIRGVLNSISCTNNLQSCKVVGSIFSPEYKVDHTNYPSVYTTDDGGYTWAAQTYSGCIMKFGGTKICNKGFKTVTCSNNGKSCTIIGTESCSIKGESVPIICETGDGGKNWQRRFSPGFTNPDGLIMSIENIGISLTGIQ